MRAPLRVQRSGATPALALSVVSILVVWVAACNRVEPIAEKLPEDDPVAMARQIDAWVEEDLDDPSGHAEARAWLREERNVLFEGEKQAVRALVDELYAGGAERVWVTGIESLGGMRVSASMALALPEEREARSALFARRAEFYGEAGDEGTQDVGQRYLTFAFD